MRIISKFTDYYDCIQKYGYTAEPIYVRTEKDAGGLCLGIYQKCFLDSNEHDFYNVKIVFCGKLYTGYKFCEESSKYSRYFYKHSEIKEYYDKRGWEWFPKFKYYGIPFAKDFENVDKINKTDYWYKKCEELSTPIIVSTRSEWKRTKISNKRCEDSKINTRLNLYNFQSVLDPMTAFQEISMFIGNMRKLEKPIPPIDDVTMAEAKGFDKWSFRKEPTKRKVK